MTKAKIDRIKKHCHTTLDYEHGRHRDRWYSWKNDAMRTYMMWVLELIEHIEKGGKSSGKTK